jgi:hypothetical protein
MFTSMLAGQERMGTSLFVTVTVKVQSFVLPDPSVAVAVTVVVPTLKKLPEAGLYAIVTFGQLSAFTAAKVTVAPHWPIPEVTVMLAGQTMFGVTLSSTVTENVQVETLPDGSVAVTVTTVTPTGNSVPEDWL